MARKILLEFEKPLEELYSKIEELRKLTVDQGVDMSEEIAQMEKRASTLRHKIFENLTPYQVMQIARHPLRPSTLEYVDVLFEGFIELHGDRLFRDDLAIVGGFAKLAEQTVLVLGHQKGYDTKSNLLRNFGMAQPEGYRKALRLMKLAEKFNRPIITLVDTPGAYPGIEAEEHGQGEAIARNLREMAQLTVPVISVITGEGGSGGALGIAVSNRVAILQYGVYSVISPEGCAAILWRDAAKAPEAAEKMKMTAPDLKALGIVETIIPEPFGGAHQDLETAAGSLKEYLLAELKSLSGLSAKDLVEQRYQRFRKFGEYTEL